MSWLLVQSTTLGTNSGGNSQATGAFATNPTVGNYLIVWAWGWTSSNHGTVAFSDTGGNVYTVPTGSQQDQTRDLWCAIGFAKVATSGATFKVTCTPNASSTGSILVVASEFSGGLASGPLDGAAVGTTGTSTSVAPGSLSFTAGDLVVAVSVDDNNTYGGSTPAGFTRVANETNGSTFEVGEAVYAIAPASPTNPARTITSAKWAAVQLALKPAAGGGGGTTAGNLLTLLGCGRTLRRPEIYPVSRRAISRRRRISIPSFPISDLRLPIEARRRGALVPIGNRQSAIGILPPGN